MKNPPAHKPPNVQIAILIPCYNEEKTIAKVIDNFHKQLPNATIYVYDNNSTDHSAKIATDHHAIVRKEPRQGKGNVVRSMFRDINADVYIMVDADNTYSASDANKLISQITNHHADMVIGDRLNSTYFKDNKRLGHNFGNRLVRKTINTIFHANIQDIMTGYRAFSCRFVKTFPALSSGFQIETEMTIHALDKNMNISTIPIKYQNRPQGSQSKLRTIRDGSKVLLTIFNMIREYKPLPFFSIISLIFLIISLILGVPIFIEFSQTSLVPRFPTLFVSTMFLVLSFLSFSTGLILDLIARKHRQLFETNLNLICKK
ncbi:glycosyltransferase [Candidatus Saccharibacteria bacterium]|nr:glycosyltransferase [Candidatus Saccharibacteria bacterium]